MTLSDQLADLADSLDRMTASGKVSSIQKSILSLEQSAKDVGKAWSGRVEERRASGRGRE